MTQAHQAGVLLLSILFALLGCRLSGAPIAFRVPLPHQHAEHLRALAAGAVVVSKEPSNEDEALAAYENALSAGVSRVPHSAAIWILTLGPQLDGPDDFRMLNSRSAGNRIEIEIIHTSARLKGTPLRRNWPYRPLLLIRLEPAPAVGKHEVRVSWQALASLSGGAQLSPSLQLKTTFQVID